MTPTLPAADELGELLRRAACDDAPPAAVSARAIGLHDSARGLAAGGAALWRRLVAVRIADAAGMAPAFGVRGAATPAQWLFRAEECEIDLRVAPRGEVWTISGQLFGFAGATEVLLSGPDVESAVQIGETNEFTFSGLPAGRYSVTAKTRGLDIVVPEFSVGPVGATPEPDDG